MPDARTESSSPLPATGPVQDPAARRRPRRRGRGPKPSEGQTATSDVNLGEVATRLEGLTAYDREQLGRRLERVRQITPVVASGEWCTERVPQLQQQIDAKDETCSFRIGSNVRKALRSRSNCTIVSVITRNP